MMLRTPAFRTFVVVLVLQLHVVRAVVGRSPARQTIPPAQAVDCDVPPGLALLQQSQQRAYEQLFREPYDICQDLFLLIDEEVDHTDPNYVMYGRRGNEGFDFIVTGMTSVDDWPAYGLPAGTVANLAATSATASIVFGVINGNYSFVALVVSFDDPRSVLPRTHAMMLLGAESIVSTLDFDCGDRRDEYDRCVAEAGIDRDLCVDKAKDDFDTCAVNDSLIGAGLGGFLGCVLGRLAKGAATGPAGVQKVLIGCAAGAIVGAAIALWRCYNQWKNNNHDCYLDYAAGLLKCWLICEGAENADEREAMP